MNHYRKYWGYSLSPLIFTLLIAYWSFDFIAQTIRNHPELNLMIMFVILMSVLLVLNRQYVIWREAAFFENYRMIYESKVSQLEIDLLLKDKKSRIANLLAVVVKLDGKIERTIDQQALSAEMEALKEYFAANLSLPQFMSGFMVALGLFGTFVGLLETLKTSGELLAGFSENGTGDMEAAVTGMLVGMKGPLSGMATAFSASLFGLLGSLLTGIMINTCQSMGRKVEHELRIFIGHAVKVSDTRPVTVAGAVEPPVSNAFLREMMARVMEQQSKAMLLFEESRQADIEVKTLFVALAHQVTAQVDTVDQALAIQEDMRAIVKEHVQQTRLVAEQISRQEALLENIQKRAVLAERAGDTLERIATQIRQNFQESTALVKSMTHAQSQAEERHERLIAAGLETLGAYHETVVDSQQRLIAGLKSLGDQLNTEVERFDHRQSSQIDQFITLQNKTADLLHELDARKKTDLDPTEHFVEMRRDIRKSREMMAADIGAEFREIKRLVNFLLKRAGA